MASAIGAMHREYGKQADKICKTCCNFETFKGFGCSKCLLYGVERSGRSDWNPRHTACGRHNVPLDRSREKSLIEQSGECDGQIRF